MTPLVATPQPALEVELGHRARADRVGHRHAPRAARGAPSQAQVAAAVDGDAGEVAEPAGHVVGGEALAQAAGVQAHAGWPPDRAAGAVGDRPAPSGGADRGRRDDAGAARHPRGASGPGRRRARG